MLGKVKCQNVLLAKLTKGVNQLATFAPYHACDHI